MSERQRCAFRLAATTAVTCVRASSQAFEKVEHALQEEKRSKPLTIPYRLSPTKKYASYFLLSYLPKQRLQKEYIKVTPAGFVYRKNTFATVEQLLSWFKTHFKDPLPTHGTLYGGESTCR